MPWMAADLASLSEPPTPDGLLVEQVRDPQALERHVRTSAVGFGSGTILTEALLLLYRTLAATGDGPPYLFLGSLDQVPVATSMVLPAGGVAGIYNVATVPWARRRGFGRAMTLAALRHGRDLGYRVGALGSSRMGYRVYSRMGFREVCRIDTFSREVVP
jgi:ribosomal protein S18 acetylase RimI-like enzyme